MPPWGRGPRGHASACAQARVARVQHHALGSLGSHWTPRKPQHPARASLQRRRGTWEVHTSAQVSARPTRHSARPTRRSARVRRHRRTRRMLWGGTSRAHACGRPRERCSGGVGAPLFGAHLSRTQSQELPSRSASSARARRVLVASVPFPELTATPAHARASAGRPRARRRAPLTPERPSVLLFAESTSIEKILDGFLTKMKLKIA